MAALNAKSTALHLLAVLGAAERLESAFLRDRLFLATTLYGIFASWGYTPKILMQGGLLTPHWWMWFEIVEEAWML